MTPVVSRPVIVLMGFVSLVEEEYQSTVSPLVTSLKKFLVNMSMPPPAGIVTVAPFECVAAVVPHAPRTTVHPVVLAPCVTSIISLSTRMKNSPVGGKLAAEVAVSVATVVLAMEPLRVVLPSYAGWQYEP
jgi:hypothetical protein